MPSMTLHFPESFDPTADIGRFGRKSSPAQAPDPRTGRIDRRGEASDNCASDAAHRASRFGASARPAASGARERARAALAVIERRRAPSLPRTRCRAVAAAAPVPRRARSAASPCGRPWQRPPSPLWSRRACRPAGPVRRRRAPVCSPSTQRIEPELTSCASHAVLTSLSRPEKPPMPGDLRVAGDDRRRRAGLAGHGDRAAAVCS